MATSSALFLSEATCLKVGMVKRKAQCRYGAAPAFLADAGPWRGLNQIALHFPRRVNFSLVVANGGRTRSNGICPPSQRLSPLTNHPRLKALNSEGPDEGLCWGGRKHHVFWPLSRQKAVRKFLCQASESPLDSSIIEQESLELGKLFSTLGSLQAKYFDFDLEGKKIYCEQMEIFLDKLQVFTTRYRLMDDPTAKEYVRRLDAMMLEAGTNLYAAMNNFRAAIENMKQDIEEQERLGPNYQQRKPAFLTIFRPEWEQLCQTDPEVQEAMTDPLIVKAVQDLAINPANVSKYVSNPRLMKFFDKVIDPRWLEQGRM